MALTLTTLTQPHPCEGQTCEPGGLKRRPPGVRCKSSPSYRGPAQCRQLLRADRPVAGSADHRQRSPSVQGARLRSQARVECGDNRQLRGGTGSDEFALADPDVLAGDSNCSVTEASPQIHSISPISRHYRMPNAGPNCLRNRSNVLRDGSSRLSKPWSRSSRRCACVIALASAE